MKKFFALVIFSALFCSCLPKSSEINSIEDLAGKRIGVQSGTTSASYISKHLPDSYLMEFITGYDAAEALKKRKIDAIVMDELPAKSIIARNDNLKIVKDKFVEEEYAVAVRKGNKELLDSINKTIREARENGTYKALVNAFISVEGNIQLPETKEAETDEYITMGTNAAFPPFEYTCRDDGKIIGFDISLGQIIADDCGKKLKILDKPFDSLIPALQTGAVDFIAAGMSATEDRRQVVDFSEPYYKTTQVIITRK
ncbi:MAG: transporter substrate-binding domain-containing protein [Treponema sp.]|nr:transporter substrate-binding domain-containing protein [Treponema sp.]